MNYIKKISILLMIATVFFSCDQVEESTIETTSVESMSGDWYIQRYIKGEEPSGNYHLITTYNTSKNNGEEMWINDNVTDYAYKFKVPVNIDNLSFSGSNIASSIDYDDDDTTPPYEITVTVSNGKVTLNDTETKGGNITNGISFDITFSDDTPAGTVYTVKGYKRTGFLEDEN